MSNQVQKVDKAKNRRIALIAVAAVIIIALLFVLAYQSLGKQAVEGMKRIDITITHVDGTTKSLQIDTTEEYLRGALEQENLVEGVEDTFGLWITGIDGYTADVDKQEWWGYTKNGQYVETGVDTTVIEDGDSFELTLNTGYDSF